MGRFRSLYLKLKPFLAVTFLMFGFAGMDVLSKAALNKGMSTYVLVVYRHALAAVVIAPFAIVLDKKVRPKMTLAIFVKIVMLSLLEPVIDQNLYFMGMKYTTATFAAAMSNILPAVTFIMACVFRLEKLQFKNIRSQAKIFGTIATVGGAMIMTLVKGPILDMFHAKDIHPTHETDGGTGATNHIKGAIMIVAGCCSWSGFIILQAITLKTYPAELSLTAWICLLGAIEGAAVALVMENGNPSVWDINWDIKLVAAVYGGIVGSGLTYYIQGVVMRERGPVFVSAFFPMCMVIVTILGSIILAEQMFLGRLLGAIVIVTGLYLVIWGKAKDQPIESPPISEHLPISEKENANNQNDAVSLPD